MIHRVTLARCVASSSRRVQVVLHLDVDRGSAEAVANALRSTLAESLASDLPDAMARACDRDRSGP